MSEARHCARASCYRSYEIFAGPMLESSDHEHYNREIFSAGTSKNPSGHKSPAFLVIGTSPRNASWLFQLSSGMSGRLASRQYHDFPLTRD